MKLLTNSSLRLNVQFTYFIWFVLLILSPRYKPQSISSQVLKKENILTCNNTANIPISGVVTINNIQVASSYTGDVAPYVNGYTSSCNGITMNPGSMLVGQLDAWSLTLTFSIPVNDLIIVLGGAGSGQSNGNENFIFNSNGGPVSIFSNNSCYSTIIGNELLSGLNATPAGGGGGYFRIHAPNAYTTLTIHGAGGRAGSILAICKDSIIPEPPTIISSSTTICFGGSVTLTSNQASGNTWSTGETTPSITVTSPSTYTVTHTNGGSASIIITEEPDPNLQITGDLTTCGEPVQLTALANGTGNTYSWSTGETGNTIIVSNPGTYTATVTTVAGCTYQKSVIVTQGLVPVVQNTSISLCSDSTTDIFDLTSTQADMSTTPGVTFAYYTNQADAMLGNANTIATPTSYTSANTTIYVRVLSTSGCFNIAELQLIINQNILATNSEISICSSDSTTIFDLTSVQADMSITPGVSFTYYTNQADAIAGNTNNIANPSAYTSANTTLYVRVSSSSCYSIAELQLNINPNPVPIITASANVICNDNPITLTSNLPTGNVWSTGETTQTITVSNQGTYTLTNNNGTCISTPVSIAILKQIDPNLQIAGNLLFCEGDSTILTATANGTGNTFLWSNGTTGPTNTVTAPGIYSVTVTTALGCQYQQSVTVAMDPIIIVNILPPSQTITCLVTEITLDATASVYQPGATFLWTATAGGNIVSGGNTLNPVVNAGGTYTLTITSATPSGCVKQSSVTVIQNTTPPPVSLTATSLIICKGESTTITAAGAISYTWNGLPGNANIQTVSPIVTTTYTVTGVGTNGCVAQKSITITVVPEIVSSLADIEICKGNKGSLDAGAGPNYTYSWNTGETTQIINPTLEGTYTVTISNGVCAKTFSAKVTYTQVPEILDIVYQDDALTIKVKNNENLPLEYSIDDGITWQSSNIFYNVHKNTEYAIRVRNVRTLCDASVLYYTFFLPNVITPNDDGHNDVISFAGIAKFKNFSATIFDRYGLQIFKATKENPVWDGKFLARVIPTATYWYIASWEDRITGKPIKLSGWILLKNR